MTTTPNLSLQDAPFNSLQLSAAVNAALQVIDALVQPAIEATLSAPPVTVSGDRGKRWIIGAAPTGAWSGRAGQIALCTDALLWLYIVPKEGFTVWDRSVDRWRDYDGAAWALRDNTTGPAMAGFIVGLSMVWNSGTSLSITGGAAHIESLDRVVSVPATITKAGLSLTASTWYHVYLFVSGGVADIEIVTTAPTAVPYSGTARGKTGVTTRRYLGSVKTAAAGGMHKFSMARNRVQYLLDTTAAPLRILTNGTATVWTAVAAAAVVPVTGTSMYAVAQNISGAVGITVSSATGGTGAFVYTINPAQALPADYPLDSSQNFYYIALAVTANGLYIDVWAYTFDR